MSPVDKLLAIEEIKQTKARYWRAMDRHNWDEFEQVFSPDCVYDIRLCNVVPAIGCPPSPDDPAALDAYVFNGARAIRKFVETAMANVRSVHHGHIPEIDILSPTEARAIFPFEDLLDFPAGASPRHVHGFGHYHEEYRRIDGKWVISSLAIHRLRLTMTNGDLL